MTAYNLSIISAFSVLLPLAAAIWKRQVIWRKFSLLVLLLLIGGLNDLASYLVIERHGNNMVNSNVYQLVEFVLLVWLFKKWPSNRQNYFHSIILCIGILLWISNFCILHSFRENSAVFRVFGSILLVFVCVNQINYTILNRENSIIFPRMLIKVGFALYFLYKAFIASFELFPIPIHFPYYAQLWYIQCGISILLNVLITIAFVCYRSTPPRSILTSGH